MKTTIRAALLAATFFLPLTANAADELCPGPCLLTGQPGGNYREHFGPAVQPWLRKAMDDVPVAVSPGSVSSAMWILEHQDAYALLQGDVTATFDLDPKYAGKLKIVKGNGIGNEPIIAIMNPVKYEMSQGTFAAIAQNASRFRWVLPQEGSGPAFTFSAMKAMAPNTVGKAKSVRYVKTMTDAINAVADGTADVAVMVEFANPKSDRFRLIKERGLKVEGVIIRDMMKLKLPNGQPAYDVCPNVDVGVAVLDFTMCTPIQLVTGADNDNQKNLRNVFDNMPADAFLPKDSGFASLWKKLTTATAAAKEAAFAKAEQLASKLSDKM